MSTEALSTPVAAPVADKQLYNQNKIAEAEALAAEALRMANEAKLAAARLAEVKKTLSMFSSKLEKAELSVQKDIKVEKTVEAVVEAPAVIKPEPEAFETKSLITEKVAEVKAPASVVVEAPKAPVAAVAVVAAPVPVVVPYKPDIVEEFLDGIGLDKACGVDDATLGFTDKPKAAPAPKAEIFVNPTRIPVKKLSPEDLLREASEKEDEANTERVQRGQGAVQYQRILVNEDFNDPFGVDHDDLVFCGKIADTCEPPEYEDEDDYELNDLVQ
eukprot:CAMPEP_0197262550 /NCGR_PEP_ID=MMETSP1432-20130617/554_1 /TAXON_ID=44447 /ORGANISM="Pseudo-nitzschia delicatissima, Strain UNC1205" /LENGTH=272 /DNA_ID=CAMNT_0042726851 /DNA_START=15 /DNA_END=833 /DNA_ORIENTATION=-